MKIKSLITVLAAFTASFALLSVDAKPGEDGEGKGKGKGRPEVNAKELFKKLPGGCSGGGVDGNAGR